MEKRKAKKEDFIDGGVHFRESEKILKKNGKFIVYLKKSIQEINTTGIIAIDEKVSKIRTKKINHIFRDIKKLVEKEDVMNGKRKWAGLNTVDDFRNVSNFIFSLPSIAQHISSVLEENEEINFNQISKYFSESKYPPVPAYHSNLETPRSAHLKIVKKKMTEILSTPVQKIQDTGPHTFKISNNIDFIQWKGLKDTCKRYEREKPDSVTVQVKDGTITIIYRNGSVELIPTNEMSQDMVSDLEMKVWIFSEDKKYKYVNYGANLSKILDIFSTGRDVQKYARSTEMSEMLSLGGYIVGDDMYFNKNHPIIKKNYTPNLPSKIKGTIYSHLENYNVITIEGPSPIETSGYIDKTLHIRTDLKKEYSKKCKKMFRNELIFDCDLYVLGGEFKIVTNGANYNSLNENSESGNSIKYLKNMERFTSRNKKMKERVLHSIIMKSKLCRYIDEVKKKATNIDFRDEIVTKLMNEMKDIFSRFLKFKFGDVENEWEFVLYLDTKIKKYIKKKNIPYEPLYNRMLLTFLTTHSDLCLLFLKTKEPYKKIYLLNHILESAKSFAQKSAHPKQKSAKR